MADDLAARCEALEREKRALETEVRCHAANPAARGAAAFETIERALHHRAMHAVHAVLLAPCADRITARLRVLLTRSYLKRS